MHHYFKPYIKFYCLIIILLFASFINAQSIIDSLKTELLNIKNQDSEISLTIDIAEQYTDINIDSSLVYLNRAENMLKENPHPYLKGKYHKVYGRYLWRENKNNEAISQYKHSISIFTEIDSLSGIPHIHNLIGNCFKDIAEHDSALHYFQISMSEIDSANNLSLLAANYNNIAIVYDEINRPDEALSYYLTALTIFRKLKQYKSAAITLNNIGLVNLNLANHYKAIECFKESIEYNLVSEDVYNLCLSYNSLGLAYKDLREDKKARFYLTEAINKSEEAGFTGLVAQSKHNLGTVFYQVQKYDSAIVMYEQSLIICKEMGIARGIILNQINIGEAYLDVEKFNYAESNLLEALNMSETNNINSFIINIYQSLFTIYERSGNFKKAMEYHNLYDVIRDSLDVVERTNKLNELQTKYETEQKELENQQLKDQNKINELTIVRQRIVMIATFFIVLLSLVILTLLIIAKAKRKKRLALLQEKNKQIEEKSLQLKKSNETKDKLFSIIAHDLRSPFSSLLGFSSLLNEEVKSDNFNNVKLYSKQLLNISSNTFELVDNLLNWARSQQAMIKTETTSITLADLAKNTISVLMSKAEEKNINIKVSIDPETKVLSDNNMLMVVLRNLISNAIKFTYKGGMIEIGCVEKESHYIIFVKDNGQGIDQGVKDKLFKNNEGHATPGTESESGSGLGLLLVSDFVKKLGGKIWVESTPNKGSTFSFTIPKTQ